MRERLYNWIRHNWQLKLVSLVLAIFLWLYVTTIQTPQITKVFMVPTHYYGLENSLLVGEGTKYVSIYLKGPQKIIKRITPEDLNVFLNLSKISTPGKYSIPIDVSVPSGLNLIKIKPKKMEVHILKAVVRFFLLTPTFLDKKVESYKIEFTPNLIKVKGRKEDIERIKYVTIFLTDDIFKKYKGKTQFLKIMKVYAITREGEIPHNITLEPNIVEVVFKIKGEEKK